MSSSEEYGRLEVVLDRSWEVQPVTWSSLTWWDPLPCGQELLRSLTNPDPLPFPSPALSVMCHPPSPRRKLPPTNLNFRSTSVSPSPIPLRGHHQHQRYSYGEFLSHSSSPLACPLPPSPDSQSYNSVFLHSESSPSYKMTKTPSISPSPLYMCSSPLYIYPTPPDSIYKTRARDQYNTRSGTKFSFSKAAPVAGKIQNHNFVCAQQFIVFFTPGVGGQSYSQSAIVTPPPVPFSRHERVGARRSVPLPPTGLNHSYY